MKRRADRGKPNWIHYLDSSLFHENYSDYWTNEKKTPTADYPTGRKKTDPLSAAQGTEQWQGQGEAVYKTDKRSRCRRFCILLLLLLLAALFSALAAFLCYYFLQPGYLQRHVEGKRARVSVRVLNETFLEEYTDPNSTEFQSLAKPFCKAVDELFKRTDAYRQYNSCQVARISDESEFAAWENASEPVDTECPCSNGSFIVTFELEFYDMKAEKMKVKIPHLINSYADLKKGEEHSFKYLGPYLISIKEIPPAPQLVHNGVLSSLSIPVYNLTFVPELKDNTSFIFVERALRFCNDVDFIFQTKPDYHSCKVTEFQEYPVAVSVDLKFSNNDTEMIESDIMDVIRDNAFRAQVNGQKYIVLGELLLTAVNITVPIEPINITDLMTTPQPDITIPPNVIHDGVRVALQLNVHNLDFTDSLKNNQSEDFLNIAKPFCNDMDKIFQDFQDTDERYIGCALDHFRHNPDEVSSLLMFRGNETEDLKNHIRMAIHKKGVKAIFGDRLLTKLGPLLVSLRDWLVWSPVNMTTTPLPTTTGPPYYKNLRLEASYPSYNVSTSPKITDNTSEIFLKYRREFCNDMDTILKKSVLISRFLQCDFIEFGDRGKSVNFNLIFDDPADDAIIADVTAAIRKYGDFRNFQGKRLVHIGGFLIDVNAGNYLFSFLNFTTTPAPPTTTTEAPTITKIVVYAYNISQPDSLLHSSSPKFKKLSKAICEDVLQMVWLSEPLAVDQSTCSLSPFRLQPLSTVLTLKSWGIDELENEKNAQKLIWTTAPPVAVGSQLFWIGNQVLSPDPPERLPAYDGIMIKSKLPLYGFSGEASTYKTKLQDFCADLDKLLNERSREQRYIGCKGTVIGRRPDEISFDLYWHGPNPIGLRNATLKSIRKYAPSKTVNGKSVYRLGNVWVHLNRSNMVNYILNTSHIMDYFTTTTPVPTTPYIVADAVLVNHTWQLYNFTFDNLPGSFNSSSPDFKFREYRFCFELKAIMQKHKALKNKDVRCSVLSYDFEPPAIHFVLVFQGRQLLRHELWEAIRWFAPSIGFNKNIRRIGVDNVIVDGEFVASHLVNLTDWQILAPVTTTTTAAPTTTPNWDLLGDGIATNLTLRLFNSTLPKELQDSTSVSFQIEANRFCDDMSEILGKSHPLSERHVRCLVHMFRDKPSSVNVFLVFDRTDDVDNVTDQVLRAIRLLAPPVKVDGHLTHLVGGVLVWLENEIESVMIPVNVSDWTTPLPTTTTTQPTTPDWSLLGDGLATNISFYLWNFTFDPELMDSESPAFKRKAYEFCSHMRLIVNQDLLSERFERCSVAGYDKDTSSVKVIFIFRGTDDAADLPQMVDETIRLHAPKTNVTKDANARQIGQAIIWLNSSLVSLHAANVSDWTTPMPTTTTEMTTPDWSQLGDGLATNFTFNLWNFTFDPKLFDRNSPAFIRKTLDFCENIRNIIDQGALSDRFSGCDLSYFDKDTSSVRVVLIFLGTDDAADLPQMVEDSIRQHAPKTNGTKDGNTRQIGQTIIWLNSSLVSLHAANVSDWTTPMPTTTTETTTPDWSLLGDALATNFTFNLWNFTFDPELFDRNSPAFNRKTFDFCENIRNIIDQDILTNRFVGCDISYFDKDTSSMRLIFIFRGTDDAADLPKMVEDAIRQHAPKTNATKDANARQIGQTIIWLNSSLVSLHAANVSDWTTPMPTTTTEMTTPDWSLLGNGLVTNFTFNLWNFTFDPKLFDRNSPAFIRKTLDFCDNIRNIIDQDALRDRFWGCDISHFDKRNSSVKVVLIFSGTDDAAVLPQMVEDTIRQHAPKTNATKGDDLRRVGQTIIWLNSSLVSLQAANVSDWTTPMPTTTTEMTTPDWSQLGDGLATNFTFNLWNFTFSPELFDRNSPAFIRKTFDFCENMKNILDQDALRDRFWGCDISHFDKDTSSVRVVLIFRGTDDAAVLPQMVEDTIRQHGPKTNATKDDDLRRVGQTIIWLNSSLVSLQAANVSDWTTPMPTTTTEMTTPDWSQLGDALATNFTFNLWNFTFAPELSDRNSPAFIRKTFDFCENIMSIIDQDALRDRFAGCDISHFDKDSSSLRAVFIFRVTDDAAVLPQMVEDTIRQHGPKTNATKGDDLRQIGRTFIWLNSSLVSLHAANASDWTTPMPTTTTEMTTPDWSQLGDGLVTNFTVNLWNFTFDPELFDRNSPAFISKTFDFCENIRNLIDQGALSGRFSGCDVSYFDKDTSSMRFVLIFHGTQDAADLAQIVEDSIRQHSSKTNITKADNVRQIGRTFIWLNSSLVSLHAANVSDWTTPMPTTTTEMTTPDWSQLGDGLATNFTFNLWNFTFDPELFDRDSTAFIRKTIDFCENMRNIFDQEILSDRYAGCDISHFDKDTSSVRVTFIFRGTDFAADLPQMVEDTIRQHAPKTNATKGDDLRQIGQTIIWLNSSLVILHAANVSDWTTPMPTTTTEMTTPDWSLLGDGLATNFTFNLWNFTFNSELFDRNNPAFISKNLDFCENMKIILDQDALSDRFSGCDISYFDKDTSSVKVVLIFLGTDDAAVLPQMVEDTIRQHAPKANATKVDDLRQIGQTIIWLNSSLVSLHAANVSDWTTPMPTTTTEMTTPDWSLLGDGLATNFTFNLWNFTFDPELFDRNNPAFIRKNLDFCENMRNIMDKNVLNDRFSGCDISHFDKDTSSVKVVFIFSGTTDAADLPKMVEDSIRQYAPKTNVTKVDDLRQIGQTIIWLNSSLVSLHAANVSDWTTPMPTTTTEMTTPDWSQLGDGLATNFTFNLWNFTFDPKLFDRSSPAFIRKTLDFCENMKTIMEQDSLGYRYAGCDISQFDKDTSSVRVVLIFLGTDDAAVLPQMVEDTIRLHAPKANATKVDDLRQIGQTIIWLNSSLVSLHAANVSDWTTPMPTTTTEMTTPDWSLLGDALATNFTFNLWNFTFDPKLFDRDSPAFVRKTLDFCENMKTIMEQDALSYRYAGCDISQFDKDTSSVRVVLIFLGTDDAAVLPQMVEDTIRLHAPKANATKGDDLRQIGQTIIWLNSSLVSLHAANVSDWTTPMPTTTTEMTTPDWSLLGDALATNFTFNLWNFTFDPKLFDRNSLAFVRKTLDFCENMKTIMEQDALSYRYAGCDITQFDKDTSSVRVVLIFLGTDDAAVLPQMVEDTIRLHAPKTNASKVDDLRQIGQTIIWLNSSLVSLHAANVSDWTTPMPTTTTEMTTPDWSLLGDGLATNFTFNLWNFTFDPELFDRNSPAFIRKTLDFCWNMRNIFDQDVLGDRYSGCDISHFDKDTSSMRVIFIFRGTDFASDLPQTVEDTIRLHAPKTNTSKVDDLRQIGQTIIWLNSSLVSLHAANVSDWTTPMPTTTTEMTTPDWSLLGDGLATNFTFILWNFTFNPELFDRNSPAFIGKTFDFCENIKNIINNGNLGSRHEGCDILNFDKDTSSVRVVLIFRGTDFAADLPQMVEDTIRQHAPKTNATKVDDLRQIGQTIIWLNSSLVSLHAANVSDWTTPMPTTTTEMTTPDWSLLGDGLATNFTFNLWNFTFDSQLFDRNSPAFIRKTLDFCENMRNIIDQDALTGRFWGCDISHFDKDTSSVRVVLIFSGTDDATVLPQMVEDTIRLHAPKTNVTKVDDLRQIGQTIIWLNSSLVSLHAANVSDWTTPMPTTTTEMTTPDWSLLGDGLATNFTFNLWNFTFDSQLFDRNSPAFIRKTLDFCENMRNIIDQDALSGRFWGCDISHFDKDTSSVRVVLIFTGTDDAAVLPQMVEDTIRLHAPKTNVTKVDDLRQIGQTIIWLNSSLVSLHAANVSDWTTPMPTTTTEMTTPDWSQLGDGIGVNMTLGLVNFTWSQDLMTTSNPEFIRHKDLFCTGIDDVMGNDEHLGQRLVRCEILEFSPSPNAVKIILVFNGTEEANILHGAVIDAIRKFGPRPLFTSGQEIRTLGDLDVLLQDSDASLSAIQVSDWTTTPVPDTTTTPILTTTIDWSSLGDGLASNISLLLYNFSHHPAFSDPDSQEFILNSNIFCNNLSMIMTNTPEMANRFHRCAVQSYSENPSKVNIVLVFTGTEGADVIPRDFEQLLLLFAPHHPLGKEGKFKDIRVVGNMNILLTNISQTLLPVNISDWTTLAPPTTTAPVTPDWNIGDSIAANVTFTMYNFSGIPGELDPNNADFRLNADYFCQELLKATTVGNNVSNIPLECQVSRESSNPLIKVVLVFQKRENPSLIPTEIIDAIRKFGPSEEFGALYEWVRLLGPSYIWLNETLIDLFPVNMSDWTRPITTTPAMTTHDWSSENGTLEGYARFLLYNFSLTDELRNPNSVQFRRKQEEICAEWNEAITNDPNLAGRIAQCSVDRFEEDNVHLMFIFHGTNGTGIEDAFRTLPDPRQTSDGRLKVGGMWVWLKYTNLELGPFTTTPLPETTTPYVYHDAIILNINTELFNLTKAEYMFDETSYGFLWLMNTFCQDLDYITQQNHPPVYLLACKIDNFRFNPDGMSFHMMYPGEMRNVFEPRELANLIRNHTKGQETTDKEIAYPVGQLLLILDTLNFTVRAANRSEEQVNFATLPMPTTTQQPIYDSILLTGIADLFNLTNVSSLYSDNSYEFLSHMADFCRELENIAVLYKSPIYLSACKISKFRSHPNGVYFQIMYPAPTPVVIGIKEWIDLIRSHSKQMLTSDGESVNRVGRLLLFLDSLNFTIQGTNQSDQETQFVTPPMPTTVQPTVFDAVILNVTAELFNLTNASYIYQKDSYGFLYQMDKFCTELTKIMEQYQPPIYLSACKIENFKYSPSWFRFKLMYFGEKSHIITASQMANLIRTHSQGLVTPLGDIAYPVGELFLVLETMNFTIHQANQSEETHHFVTLPMPTTTQPAIFDSILLNVSAELYNLTNASYLYQENSYEFIYYMTEFCKELKLIILRNEPPIYTSSCKIDKFRFKPGGMNFKLMYPGNREDIITAKEMADLIRSDRLGIATVEGNIVYQVGNFFLILETMNFTAQTANKSEEEVNFVTPPMPTTPQPIVFDAIILNVSAELYNLTNASYLYQKDSYGFLDRMAKFCAELQNILNLNARPISFTACKIESFRFSPGGIQFKLMYPGSKDDIITAKQMANLIRNYSFGIATPAGDVVYPVGQLLLILDSLNFTVHGANSSEEEANFVTLPMPTTTPTTFFDAIILNVSAELYNLTNASYLYQKDSYGFLDRMAKFCTELQYILTMKEPPVHTTSCKIENFRFNPGGMRFKLMYPGRLSDVIAAKEMADLIRTHTTGIATLVGDIVYPVGQLFLILDTLNFTVHGANQSQQEINFVTLPMPTTTPPTIFDTTYLRVGVGLYNFTWVPDLADPRSQLFRKRAANFCETIDGYFRRSSHTKKLYEGCRVNNFSKIPEQINFGLMFKGDQRSDIQNKAVDVLVEFGLHVGGLEAIRIKVGDLILILDDVNTIVEMVNATDFRELTPVEMIFQTKNFTFRMEDFDRNTGSLRNLSRVMCDELLDKFRRSPIGAGFSECNFRPMRPNVTLGMELKFDSLNQTLATELVARQLELISKTMASDGTNGIVLNDVILLMTEPQIVNVGVRLALHDLDYTEDLKDPESEKFKMLSQSFCNDIRHFYQNSYLRRNYRACQILSFTKEPSLAEAVLQFAVATTEGLAPHIVHVLNSSAPHVTRNNMHLLQIGDLWVILGDMGPMGSPLGDSNWQPPQLGSTPLPGEQASTRVWLLRLLNEPSVTDRSAVLFSFDLLNFTYDSRLQNHSSAYFIRHAGTFCQKIDSVFRQSALANDYATCQVINFSPNKPHPKVRFQLFLRPTSKLTNISATFGNSLYNSFPKTLHNGMEILTVGKYQLIFPGPVQPPKQTTDFVLKVVITFNLHNFTYTNSLADPESVDFLQKQDAFCTDYFRSPSEIIFRIYNCVLFVRRNTITFDPHLRSSSGFTTVCYL